MFGSRVVYYILGGCIITVASPARLPFEASMSAVIEPHSFSFRRVLYFRLSAVALGLPLESRAGPQHCRLGVYMIAVFLGG